MQGNQCMYDIVCVLLYTYMHARNLKVYKIEKLELPMEGNPRSNPGIDMALKWSFWTLPISTILIVPHINSMHTEQLLLKAKVAESVAS